jgi:hypothetical protein
MLRYPNDLLASEISCVSRWGMRRAAKKLARLAWLAESAKLD